MTLTPALKFAIIAFAFAVNLLLLTWTAIKIDVLSLGMREEVFNIGLTVFTTLNAGAGALLAYLGLKAPTMKEDGDGG